MKVSLLIFTLLNVLFTIYTSGQNTKCNKFFNKARYLDSVEQNYKSAFKYYSKAITCGVKSPLCLIRRAEIRYKLWYPKRRGSIEKIVADYNSVFKQYPYHLEAGLSLANFFFEIKNFSFTTMYLDSLDSRHPKNSEVYLLKAKIYLSYGDTITSDSLFKRSLEYASDEGILSYNIAEFCYGKGFYSRAVNFYFLALEKMGVIKFGISYNFVYSLWRSGNKKEACYYLKTLPKRIYFDEEWNKLYKYCGN